jgi:hypothetical protein
VSLYFLVEGERTEKLVYRGWLQHALPALSEVDRPDDLHDKEYFILAGYGYPSYFRRIRDSHRDIRENLSIDHFFVCVDSEELTYEDKLAEVGAEIEASERETGVYELNHAFRTHLIIQHCCVETWFLGNQKMMPAVPEAEPLRSYAAFYDVRSNDPESMGCFGGFSRRAQFHLAYLRAMFRARGEHVRYSKAFPGPVVHGHYYDALWARAQDGHIASFGALAKIFRDLL